MSASIRLQPDLTLVVDFAGVIREASASNGVAGEALDVWVGRPWIDTVRDAERGDIARLVDHARRGGIAGIGQVAQRFPSGRVLPIEYTTVRLGNEARIVAAGKQLRAVAQLQSSLLDTQRALEQDYWKLRPVETRYRMLLNSAQDAVVTLQLRGLRIAELNPAAAQLLAGTEADAAVLQDVDLGSLLDEHDRGLLIDLVQCTRDGGLASATLRRLGGQAGPWLVRASLIPAAPDRPMLQLQIAQAESPSESAASADAVSLADLIERFPDGFVVIDRSGRIANANPAFVEMVQEGSASALLGQPLGQWLRRPGADMTVLLANVERFGSLRLLSTTVHGALNSETEVELSAVGDRDEGPRRIAVLLRDIGRRLSRAAGDSDALGGAVAERLGRTPLRTLVEEATAAIERHYVEAALRLTAGNRTAAAQLLGLSRQSLHAKLQRYACDPEPKSTMQPDPS